MMLKGVEFLIRFTKIEEFNTFVTGSCQEEMFMSRVELD
jgi:hypothetical protein